MQMVIERLQDPAGLLGERRVFNAPATIGGQTHVIDGSEWRAFPALYDADTLLALQDAYLSDADREVALLGGVARINASIGWQRMADPLEAEALIGMARGSEMPRVRLMLSVMPDQDTEGFSAWFAEFAKSEAAASEMVLPCCKLYGREPFFQRNLEAVWKAGWLPLVFSGDPAPLAQYAAETSRPIVFRHVVNVSDFEKIADGEVAGMANADIKREMPGNTHFDSVAALEDVVHMDMPVKTFTTAAAIWRTCPPHYLLPVDEARRAAMVVRPPISDEFTREACLSRFDDIDLIATDHVAPGATTGPGLQSEHHFLPALLDLAQRLGRPAADVLSKASSRAASLFGHDANDWAVALVAPVRAGMPTSISLPGIEVSRDPFASNAFQYRVVAIVRGETLWPTRYMPYYVA